MMQLVLVLAAVRAATLPSAEAGLPASLDLEVIRALPVQHDGRWPPLDTVARDIVESVTGEMFYRGHDPVLMLLAWTFEHETWEAEPLIGIANAELRTELQLPASRTVYSFEELENHGPLRTMIRELARRERGGKLDPLESKVSKIHEKLNTLWEVFNGQAIRPIPDPGAILGAWHSIPLPEGDERASANPVVSAWQAAHEAFVADDAPAFASACNGLVQALGDLLAAHQPDPKLIATELRYNRVQPFRTAWMVMVVGAGLAAVAMLVRRRWFDVLAVLGLLAGFGVLTYGLLLRWQIAGRIPAANMFESLLFLSWGMGVFAIGAMLVQRQRVVPLTASAMGAVALVLADLLPLDHYVRPIVPVLMDTIWMSIHVPIIMVSYSVLALAVLIAHAQLAVMATAPSRRRLVEGIDSLHYWYVLVGSILLLAGIVTGSMWGASSWGRYWGWDPKEVWSLIACVGYLAILHVRVDHDRVPRWAYVVAAVLGSALLVVVVPKMTPLTSGKVLGLAGAVGGMVFFVLARGKFATAVKSIVAFWLIIMTYVGVNYVLGTGLHSYGFGTGAVARNMFLVGGIDLAVVAACYGAYVIRRRSVPASAVGSPAPATA